MIEITETTVWTASRTRVAVGTIFEREYRAADGTTRTGPAAPLYLYTDQGEDKVVGGAGSHLTIDDEEWEVVLVEPRPDNRGRVVLRRLA
ncbi:hypothetical protein ALI144C_10435 [Actinosynnema sp. ALI-1.44]|uniref:hypothetical protein n=1 Tax=Actinosynnema sp. ALI-1.44 TaxID=1933779 RepID=UPI00097BAC49|nr:hypothetical protein [Actinosynnema sp. ALI-1.44]ONI87041.1 hypothetical protein ALI144C_10435 [Actinosynnema sp. ALI-1.44]